MAGTVAIGRRSLTPATTVTARTPSSSAFGGAQPSYMLGAPTTASTLVSVSPTVVARRGYFPSSPAPLPSLLFPSPRRSRLTRRPRRVAGQARPLLNQHRPGLVLYRRQPHCASGESTTQTGQKLTAGHRPLPRPHQPVAGQRQHHAGLALRRRQHQPDLDAGGRGRPQGLSGLKVALMAGVHYLRHGLLTCRVRPDPRMVHAGEDEWTMHHTRDVILYTLEPRTVGGHILSHGAKRVNNKKKQLKLTGTSLSPVLYSAQKRLPGQLPIVTAPSRLPPRPISCLNPYPPTSRPSRM